MLINKSALELEKLQQALNECSFNSWYKHFEKITINSICIEISADVLKYLQDEIVVLPKECYSDNENYGAHSDWGDQDDEVPTPEFSEFSQKINNNIKILQGSSFIKSNWHCPKDAFWITAGQTLKVKDITDAYQLLKASSILKKDLNNCDLPLQVNGSEIDNQYYLVMREWLEIYPGTEFRCFVRQRKLIAISPRDWPQYHKHIIQQRRSIVGDILSLFKEKIQNHFPLEDFCFDVIRQAKDHVILVDFSPFDENFTDPLAFDWEFLRDNTLEQNGVSVVNTSGDSEEHYPEFRYLTSDCGIQPNKRNNFGIPQDIIDMFSNPNQGTSNLTDLLSARVQEELRLQNEGNLN